MPALSTWLLFCAAVLGLMVSPGPNMAFIVSQALARGARGGVAAAAGIFFADLTMTVLVCAGIAGAAMAWPWSFDLLRAFGALYLVWLGVQALRARPAQADATAQARADGRPHARMHGRTQARIVRDATLISLLNPKALLFFLVFLPQFVDPRRGPVVWQLAALGIALSAIAFAFHAALGWFASRWTSARAPSAAGARRLQRLHALVLFALALRLLWLDAPLRPS